MGSYVEVAMEGRLMRKEVKVEGGEKYITISST